MNELKWYSEKMYIFGKFELGKFSDIYSFITRTLTDEESQLLVNYITEVNTNMNSKTACFDVLMNWFFEYYVLEEEE